MKVVINSCYGGFGLSDDAIKLYGELKGLNLISHAGEYSELTGLDWYVDEVKEENYFCYRDIERDDPLLVQVVEQLGEAANSQYSALKIVDIPNNVEWQIEEYDGNEWIAEVHKTWC